MTFLATAPFLKRIIVGIERTSYFAAVAWFSSTLSFTMRRSWRSPAISLRTGATTRHGPHHGAQKSTRTGCSDSMTSAWKLVSVTLDRVPAMVVQGLLGDAGRARLSTIQSVVARAAAWSVRRNGVARSGAAAWR